MYATKNKYEK